ncbi:Hsp90 cochaperone SBA1 [Spizellomyces punctatus DAOM BR117]|uniref:CS domain-containing protein n=1 Tax=Spizellomyces punctatus (strain DAOM BR117) TaxID=645134 RepID=A0A0L0HG20_SPIPD|nr:Hsp90 cochaperone SBA1 [Spizellomyces punctatus DAOM BR117]KNC99743.1 hypothetical protein SPPG_05123 [Spizellomyces punctatus DAOM BR117]|eukprot:XP_016607783.1 hypothetical protein SPPG_05123 [Spizellomyces punctatus DAOM BR117]
MQNATCIIGLDAENVRETSGGRACHWAVPVVALRVPGHKKLCFPQSDLFCKIFPLLLDCFLTPRNMMATDKALAPEVLWAQRADELFVTINLSDVEDPKIDVTPSSLKFAGKARGNQYAVTIDFYKEVDPETSKQSITARNLSFVLAKKEKGQEYWPRLTKEKGKLHWLKTDFSKWKDEDEDDEPVQAGFEGMDFSQFQGMGGMGGMSGMGGLGGLGGLGGMGGMDFGAGGMDFGSDEKDSDDEDDEDMPDLEVAQDKTEDSA